MIQADSAYSAALRDLQAAVELQSRRVLEQQIEMAIALLDTLDGDCDIEEDHDRELVCEDEGYTFQWGGAHYAEDQRFVIVRGWNGREELRSVA